MRELTTLQTVEEAQRLAAYLALQAIESSFEEDNDEWVVWVLNDDDRDKATEILNEYQTDPTHERYEKAERKVRSVIKEAERLQKQQDHSARLKKRWEGSWLHSYPATYIIIGLCVVISAVATDWKRMQSSQFGLPALCNNADSRVYQELHMLTPARFEETNGRSVPFYRVYPGDRMPMMINSWERFGVRAEATWNHLAYSFSKFEIWKVIGPAFLHFGVAHILFNMMWMKSVGGAVEFVRGTKRYLLLCLIIAVTSNVAQLFWSGPNFGGMSGVVFGLIGYVWMKGKTQPRLGIGLDQRTVVYSIAFLLLCMTGAIGNVANAAHLVGFLTGIVIGSRQAIWKKIRFADR